MEAHTGIERFMSAASLYAIAAASAQRATNATDRASSSLFNSKGSVFMVQ
jgi:hypothetical protein